MRSLRILLALFLLAGCGAGGGVPVVSVGPEGVGLYQKSQETVTPWADIKGMHVGGQLTLRNSR